MGRNERIAFAVVGGLFPHVGSIKSNAQKLAQQRADKKTEKNAARRRQNSEWTSSTSNAFQRRANKWNRAPGPDDSMDPNAQQAPGADPYGGAPIPPQWGGDAPWFAPQAPAQAPAQSFDLSPWGYGPQPSPTDDYYGAAPEDAEE